MDYINGFSIFEQNNPVNHDITILFNPDTSYSSYVLHIIKDNSVYKTIKKIDVVQTEFTLSETGVYEIEVVYYDVNMNEYKISSGRYIIDKEPPILKIGKKSYDVFIGKNINVMNGVSAIDNIDGNITNKITTNEKELNFDIKGTKKIVYTALDSAGNSSSDEVFVNVINGSASLFIFQIIFMLILFTVVLGMLIYNKSLKLERRIARFSISPLKDSSISLFDSINHKVLELITKFNNVLYRSDFIKKYSKKYSKYLNITNTLTRSSMDFVSIKFLSSFLCIIIAIFAKTIRFKVFNLYDVYIPLVFGFFLPDFIYYFKFKNYKKNLENDLLQAIIIMNNAFKSGRSIVQSINLVSMELDGPMAEEFKKMHMELSFGLGLDVVFNRLYQRLKIEEIAYLTASLTILNQTGGNIVQVFSSIEKSLFNKKKLRLELKSLTSGSRMIFNVLMVVPIAFVLLIWFINPSYFIPLLTSKLGMIIITIVLVYYIIYVIVIRKLLRVRI